VIAPDLFRDVLIREQKRADRFDESLVLVLVTLKEEATESSNWISLIDALHAIKRETDVLGWFERGSVLGLMLPGIDATDTSFAREVESQVKQAIATRLDVDARSDVSIRLYRHVGQTPGEPQADETASFLRELRATRADRVRGALKRVLDVVGSATLLLLVAPLFLLIAGLVKLLSPGPVFFRQVRVGEYGKPFTMLKFRTMHVNNDQTIHKEFVSQLIKGTVPASGDTSATPFKISHDPRVTPVGRLLRKTSLDELPQLWNVLRGEMSLVGPRPPLCYEVEQYKSWHYRRVLEAKPGITGLWQVSGRSRTTFDDMVRLDLRYAKNCSAWMDIKILLATPRAVISGKGAC
jgi:exopolysaccharide biosynthesis polyprenyl glycosylphosphotransferase